MFLHTIVHTFFGPNKQVENQEGEGVEFPFLGPRGAADGLKIRTNTVFRTKSVFKERVN